ncbi:MAG: hypothetical protein JXQ90_13345 [Cyclobacteriaceae bacterium]
MLKFLRVRRVIEGVLITVLLTGLVGCQSDVTCTPQVNNNTNLRSIFKPCREFIYSAKYWDKEFNLISEEQISVSATGGQWEYEPEKQDEIVIKYQFDEQEIDRLSKYSINSSFSNWAESTKTGIIETASETWMHPFRSNQYSFTEIAPFPSVKFPLEAGKIWSSDLQIYEGWGDWSNKTINQRYSVQGQEKIPLDFETLDAWFIRSRSISDLGTSTHDFWYNDQYGFVKMVIKNHAGQLLQFELIEVIEP